MTENNLKNGTANKVNFQKILDKELWEIEKSAKTPHLLLHACCAPCSSYVLEYLNKYFDITLFYFNPNISPESEYKYRLSELERLVGELPHVNNIDFLEAPYDPNEFYSLTKGHENDLERGKRCQICLSYRIEMSAKAARKINADYFTTTLSISPYKDCLFLNTCGEKMSKIYGVRYLFSDFKKKNGYKRSIELSHEYKLYRQDFCGCIYSRLQRQREKSAD